MERQKTVMIVKRESEAYKVVNRPKGVQNVAAPMNTFSDRVNVLAERTKLSAYWA